MNKITIVSAVGDNGEIGWQGTLPWKVPGELGWFKELTTKNENGNTLVYGRKTFESFGNKPLPGRKNIVISNTLQQPAPVAQCGYEVRKMLKWACMEQARDFPQESVFIIGGTGIFAEGLEFANQVWLSHIPGSFGGSDTFFPFMNPRIWHAVAERKFEHFTAVLYQRR